MSGSDKETSFFSECDYSIGPNYAPIYNILTATTGLSSEYNPSFGIYGSVIRTPLLDNVSSDEELNKIAASFANELLPVWVVFNKNSKNFPVIFYKTASTDYPFNTIDTVVDKISTLNTGFLNEYINKITGDNNIRLITKYSK
jgi:hypothetical protein